MPRLLVTGGSGFVGGRIVELAPLGWEVHAHWRSRKPPESAVPHQAELSDANATRSMLVAAKPDVVIHTAYDMAAGSEPNLLWSRNVHAAAAAVGARVIFMSTDLVFDGRRGWYREDEPPNPSIEYGAWKAELEPEVLGAGGVVVRTSLVWGIDPLAEPLAKMVVEPLARGESPRLFADEWRTPTEVHDLARALWKAIDVPGPRILHFSGPERISRLDFGRLVARKFGHDPDRLPPFYRAELAPSRPADTSLAITSTLEVVDATFRSPSEVLEVQ